MDEKTDPTILGPQYATSLNNVLLDRGKIEPRGGLRKARDLASDLAVLQLAHLPVESDATANVVVSVALSDLVAVRTWGIHIAGGPVSGLGVDSGLFRPIVADRGSIVPFLQHVYFMFGVQKAMGSLRIWHRGEGIYELDYNYLGIGAPSKVVPDSEPLDTDVSLLGWPIGTFSFAVSLARIDDEGTLLAESNREIADLRGEEKLVVEADRQVLLTVETPGGTTRDTWTHFQVYVKTVAVGPWWIPPPPPPGEDPTSEFAEESTFRLAAVIPKDGQDVTAFPDDITRFELRLTEKHAAGLGLSELLSPVEGAPLSTAITGPFAPTQNGQPPAARIATAYQEMMMYASVERGTKGLLFYSEPGNPDHVGGKNFVNFGDKVATDITALVVYQGRLIIFKEAAVYVLAGTIQHHSNNAAALNIARPLATFQIFKAVDGIGCVNTGGGVGVLECDGVLYFNAADGIYAFNGLSAVKVSAALDTRFSFIPVELRKHCTMANDTENGLLWIRYAHPDVASGGTMLCYDYRHKDPRTNLGVWTVHDFSEGSSIGLLSIASARPIADQDPINITHKDFVGGTVDGRIVYSGRKIPTDDGIAIVWNYTTAPLDLGLAERNKRFHYLSVEHTMEDGPIDGWVSVESGRGERTIPFSFPAAGSKVKKVRIGSRGSRVAVRFSGTRHTQNIDTPAINGFAIDAEPIGHR